MKEIPLIQGLVALVDDEDFEWLSRWKWHAWKCRHHKTYYARRQAGKTELLMHRVILGLSRGDGIQSDHADRDGLNNCRGNLRICTRAQNGTNRSSATGSTSSYLGVSWDRTRGKWKAASVMPRQGPGRRVNLGRFDDEQDAARAYDRFAIEHFGEFANPNFPS